MTSTSIDELNRQYTGRYVVVDPAHRELARWAGIVGQIKAISQNRLALVQFEGADCGWHEVELDALRASPPPADREAPSESLSPKKTK